MFERHICTAGCPTATVNSASLVLNPCTAACRLVYGTHVQQVAILIGSCKTVNKHAVLLQNAYGSQKCVGNANLGTDPI